MIFMNTQNSKTKEPYRFVLNLLQRLDLRSLNKHVTLQNLSIYYTQKNMKKHYKNNKLKIISPTWNDEFDLSDGFYSVLDIQDYIEHIIKKHVALHTNPSIPIYISKINHKLVLKITDG